MTQIQFPTPIAMSTPKDTSVLQARERACVTRRGIVIQPSFKAEQISAEHATSNGSCEPKTTHTHHEARPEDGSAVRL